jgi:hypothetical protein
MGPKDPSKQSSVDPSANKISRRRFARNAAAIAAVTLSPSGILAIPNLGGANTAVVGADENKRKLNPAQLQDVEAKLANIIRKYGDRLSEEQRQHLRRMLSYNETLLAPIRAFPLKNGDSPVMVLKLSTGKNSAQSTLRSSDMHKTANEARDNEGSAS